MTTGEAPSIRDGARRLSALRQTLRALLASAPGGASVRTLLDIERVTGVHRKLAWQMHRLCAPGDSVADGRFLPSRAQLKRFVDSVVASGGSAEVAAAVHQRYDEFEAFVLEVCGSWASFESMVSDEDREAAADVTARHREAMHEAACHIYGIRTATRFSCNIMAPSQTNHDLLDLVHIDGFVGLRRQRGTRSWPVNRMDFRCKGADGVWRPPDRVEHFDAEAYRRHGVGIIPEFSTAPLPEFEVVRAPESHAGQAMATFNDVGLLAAADLTFGIILRNAYDRAGLPNSLGHRADFSVTVDLPCGTLISDVLIHESIDYGRPHVATLRIDADLPIFQVTQMRTHEAPVRENIEEAGMGAVLLSQNDEVPGYGAMLRRCFERTGRDASEFRAWRCVVQRPIMSTVVSVRFT